MCGGSSCDNMVAGGMVIKNEFSVIFKVMYYLRIL